MPLSNLIYNSIADLAVVIGTDDIVAYVSYSNTVGDRGGGNFRWSTVAVNTIDNINVVGIPGSASGRWIRLMNSSYNTGTFTFPVAIGTNTYTVSHGLAFTPNYVGLTPSNDPALAYVAGVIAITATTFTVKIGTLPIVTGTASYRYIATR